MAAKIYDLIVVGGGPAGLAAALEARSKGLSKVLIIERDRELGGILNQCIHNGFGLHYFKEELTGPEYALRFIDLVGQAGIELMLDTMVLELRTGSNIGDKHRVQTVSSQYGYLELETRSLVLAMGCRERTRGAIQIPGTRPAGVLTAGAAQRLVNIDGWMVGKRVLILGSGDIGLIMARRLTLEGAKVLACIELMPNSAGLKRNIVQCLEDYNIPLLLSHTITRIEGQKRVERVIVQAVDQDFKPLPDTEQVFECDTVLLSVGLIPENELSRQAKIQLDPRTRGPIVNQQMECSSPGIFACGNVLHVHDLVDYVTEESQLAGRAAADYVMNGGRESSGRTIEIKAGKAIAYTVPQLIDPSLPSQKIRLFFRVRKPYDRPASVVVKNGQEKLASFKKPFMLPGEMQEILLTKEHLANAGGKSLTISIEEA